MQAVHGLWKEAQVGPSTLLWLGEEGNSVPQNMNVHLQPS